MPSVAVGIQGWPGGLGRQGYVPSEEPWDWLTLGQPHPSVALGKEQGPGGGFASTFWKKRVDTKWTGGVSPLDFLLLQGWGIPSPKEGEGQRGSSGV